jgi:D-sedoheptulose 7-phosphate isomerase
MSSHLVQKTQRPQRKAVFPRALSPAMPPSRAPSVFDAYTQSLTEALHRIDRDAVLVLSERIWRLWQDGRRLFLCGNGGSAASATHLANDLIYGVAPGRAAVQVECLNSNTSILTCLGNDTGYENVFALQLRTLAREGDGLIVFSGSGNSPNILRALEEARRIGVWTAGMLGFSGGAALKQVDVAVHFTIDDMEIAEDLQMIVGHMIKRELKTRVQTQ